MSKTEERLKRIKKQKMKESERKGMTRKNKSRVEGKNTRKGRERIKE